jgi:hypothetical protein
VQGTFGTRCVQRSAAANAWDALRYDARSMHRAAPLFVAIAFIVACGKSGASDDGCSKDTDCKGDRVCNHGRCEEDDSRASELEDRALRIDKLEAQKKRLETENSVLKETLEEMRRRQIDPTQGASDDPDAGTGIPECDAYFAELKRCMMKDPSMGAALKSAEEAYRNVSPAARKDVANACRMAMDAAKNACK